MSRAHEVTRHVAEAVRMLECADPDGFPTTTDSGKAIPWEVTAALQNYFISQAQVHATLALVAATRKD